MRKKAVSPKRPVVGLSRTLAARGWIYRAFLKRLAKYVRLSRRFRLLERQLKRIDVVHSNEKGYLARSKDREIGRLNELLEAYRSKLEITQAGALDRMYELNKVVGLSFETRDINDKITEKRFEQFSNTDSPKDLRSSLSPAYQAEYDAAYEHHRQMGYDAGATEAEIESTWRAHEEEIVATFETNIANGTYQQ